MPVCELAKSKLNVNEDRIKGKTKDRYTIWGIGENFCDKFLEELK